MPISLDDARDLAARFMTPGRFFTTLPLAWSHATEEISWEVFQGRLLDHNQTREQRTFESFSARLPDASEAILSLKLEPGHLHLVRGIESHVHEGYDAGGGVFRTRETRRWVRELVRSFDLDDFAAVEDLRAEMDLAMHEAITGTRLPLTSLEAPLPQFSFGQLYFPAFAAEKSPSSWRELLPPDGLPLDSRRLEFILRAIPADELPDLASWLCSHQAAVPALLRQLFLDVSLSPYTGFVAQVLALLPMLCHRGVLDQTAQIDFLGWLLRLVCRHLSAYDLVVFHHRGANYPDALLLDSVLTVYLDWTERRPELFAGDLGRLRRRALRQACLLRRHYEGLQVPDLPTSPGENQRVLPERHPRVSEEQLLHPGRRRRRLYSDRRLELTPLIRDLLRQSVLDLDHPDEWAELGTGLFLDRPFNTGKAPAEPDATPLFTSLSFSRLMAETRLRVLNDDHQLKRQPPNNHVPAGLPLDRIGPPLKRGSISLADARLTWPDIVFRHTLAGGLRSFWPMIALDSLRATLDLGWLDEPVLLARLPDEPGVGVYDSTLRLRLEIEEDPSQGYIHRRGLERPRAGFRVLARNAQS